MQTPQPVHFVQSTYVAFLSDLYLVVADVSLDLFDLRIGVEFYLVMLGHIDHLGSQDTDGTVDGGEGLVEAGHHTADGSGSSPP